MRTRMISGKLDIFTDRDLLIRALEETNTAYRPMDPGFYLYRQIMNWEQREKALEQFIELVYVTLAAWNMNSRGARLQDFPAFMKSIKCSWSHISGLSDFVLQDVTGAYIQKEISALFNELDLVAEGKPPLVTFSKTLHFFLPNLIVPIDRTYTMNFFYGTTNIPNARELQLSRFWEIELECGRFAADMDFTIYKDTLWNRSIPKIIDNAIIGYSRIIKRAR